MRTFSLFAIAFGTLWALLCAMVYAATTLPYPDPTDEMLAAQQAELLLLGRLCIAGLVLTALGVLAWLLAWWRSRPQSNSDT